MLLLVTFSNCLKFLRNNLVEGYLVGGCGCFHLLFNVLKFLYLPLFSLPNLLYISSNSPLLHSHIPESQACWLVLLSLIYTHRHAKPNHHLPLLSQHFHLNSTSQTNTFIIDSWKKLWWVVFVLFFVKWTLSC